MEVLIKFKDILEINKFLGEPIKEKEGSTVINISNAGGHYKSYNKGIAFFCKFNQTCEEEARLIFHRHFQKMIRKQ